jgi:hypothetical protein
MSKNMTETTPTLDKGKLLEVAKKGGFRNTVAKAIIEDIRALAEVRVLRKQCEAQESALVARLGTRMIEDGVSGYTTTEGVVQAVASKRTEIDRSLLTPEQVKAYSKTIEYAKMEVRAAVSPEVSGK